MEVCRPVNGWCRSVWFRGILTGTCTLMGIVDWTGIVRFNVIGRDVPAGSVMLAFELTARPPVLMTTCALGMGNSAGQHNGRVLRYRQVEIERELGIYCDGRVNACLIHFDKVAIQSAKYVVPKGIQGIHSRS